MRIFIIGRAVDTAGKSVRVSAGFDANVEWSMFEPGHTLRNPHGVPSRIDEIELTDDDGRAFIHAIGAGYVRLPDWLWRLGTWLRRHWRLRLAAQTKSPAAPL